MKRRIPAPADAARLLAAAVLVALALGLLPALVYADPLDPTWSGGFWEDDDFDSVILLVSSLEVPLPGTPVTCEPTTEVIEVLRPLVLVPPLIERRLGFLRRGPPLA
jgi:hypothetical protein